MCCLQKLHTEVCHPQAGGFLINNSLKTEIYGWLPWWLGASTADAAPISMGSPSAVPVPCISMRERSSTTIPPASRALLITCIAKKIELVHQASCEQTLKPVQIQRRGFKKSIQDHLHKIIGFQCLPVVVMGHWEQSTMMTCI